MPERARRRRGISDGLLTLGLVGLALVVGAFVASLVLRWVPSSAPPETSPGRAREGPAPPPSAGVVDRSRIRVEVLNAAHVPGLADRMTGLLRGQGFDVVSYDNASEVRADSRILDRVGKPELAREVGLALPGTPIRTELSRDRFVDVTVLVGRDYGRYFDEEGRAGSPGVPRGPLSRLRSLVAHLRSALGL